MARQPCDDAPIRCGQSFISHPRSVAADMSGKLLSSQEAAQRLGISVTSLYDWLARSDRGQFVLRGQRLTIQYLQGGARGQGRIKLEESEIERLKDAMRVHPHPSVARHQTVRRSIIRGSPYRWADPVREPSHATEITAAHLLTAPQRRLTKRPASPKTPPIRDADRRPQRLLVMLPPFPPVVVEGHLRRVADQFRQCLNRTSRPVGPISRQHAVRERVPACVARVSPSHRILIPAQFRLQRQEPHHSGHALPGIALRVAKNRACPNPSEPLPSARGSARPPPVARGSCASSSSSMTRPATSCLDRTLPRRPRSTAPVHRMGASPCEWPRTGNSPKQGSVAP